MAFAQHDVEAAYRVIAPHLRRTPVVPVNGSEFGLAPFELFLKLESLQHGGSFKSRGAFANLLLREVPAAGVVAASGGNHGAAVAFAAQRLGIRAHIFVPTISSRAKTDRIRSYGAELRIEGALYDDALALSRVWAQQHGAMQLHAFDQRETLLGTATVGLELARDVAGLDTVLAGVGGGGLIGGIAAWFDSKVRVIGVEPDASPTLTHALRAGGPVEAPAGGLAADSLAPVRVGELTYPIARDHVDRVLLVSDDEIRGAQRALWNVCRVVAEPGGAAALAALLSGKYLPAKDEKVAVVVSGGNTTAVDFG